MSRLSKKYKCHIHKHPGYDLEDAHTDKYLIDFAKVINQSKLVLTCSGKPRTRYGKYIEIPMCNTAIVGDIPLDNADNYDYIIDVNMKMTDNEIIDKIIYYLENNDKRLEKIKKGLEFCKNYTQEDYAKKLYKIISK